MSKYINSLLDNYEILYWEKKVERVAEICKREDFPYDVEFLNSLPAGILLLIYKLDEDLNGGR